MQTILKLVRHISLSLSVLFLLLHSFLPHAHKSELEGKALSKLESYEQADVFEAIIDALKNDQGEGHLENFQPSRDADANFNSLHFSLLADLSFSLKIEYDSIVHDNTQDLSFPVCDFKAKSGFSKAINGRAPPFLMI